MPRRKVIIDQDTMGPATTNLQAVAMLLNAPDVDVLGICVSTGDHWRDHQVRHALRLLEIMDRTGVPVVPGAEMPLVSTPADVAAWEKLHGKLIYNGAWDLERPGKWLERRHTPDLPEGNPTTSPVTEHAALFIARVARAYPGEISLWCGGPMTNLALALQFEPRLPSLVRELHFMGGAFNPQTDAREFRHSPRREFNLRFDPEAARIVFRAKWPRVTCSPIDVSTHTRCTAELFAAIAQAGTPLARYLHEFGKRDRPMWDEVAAASWIDDTIVTRYEDLFLDVSLDRSAELGDTLSWEPGQEPGLGECRARVQKQLDDARFYEMFVALSSA